MPDLGGGSINYLSNLRFIVLGISGTIRVGIGIAAFFINISLLILYIFLPNILYFPNSTNWINILLNGNYANLYKDAIN